MLRTLGLDIVGPLIVYQLLRGAGMSEVWSLVLALITDDPKALSTGTALTFNRTVPWLITGLLFAWAFWWGARLRAQKP